MNKASWRKKLLSARKTLSPQEHLHLSRKLNKHLISGLSWYQVRRVHVFLSISTLKEPCTRPLCHFLWSLGVETLTSVVCQENDALKHVRFDQHTCFSPDRWGIPVPKKTKALSSAPNIDLIVVPLLGFGQHGHRIGYGKGYYDAFLKEHPKAKKVGLCLYPNPIPFAPEIHDIALNACATPKRLHFF